MSGSSAEAWPRAGFLCPAAGLGGAERVLLLLLETWVREGRRPLPVLVSFVDGPLLERARALGLAVHLIPLPDHLLALDEAALAAPGSFLRTGAAALGYVARLRRTLARLRLDVLHTNGLKAHLLGALACPRGTALTWHVHDYVGSRPVSRQGLRLLAWRTRGVVAVSEAQAADIRQVLGPRPAVRVVANAVDLQRFSPRGEVADLDRLSGLPALGPGGLRVGLIATYSHWKGHRIFLAACARVCRTLSGGPPVRIYVIGGPIYDTRAAQLSREVLLGQVDALGLSGQVGLVPFQPETAACYRALDVVVHASTEPEPFGLVVGEALACGRALVAARSAGALELFAPGEELLTTPPGDEAALAEAMIALWSDADSRARLGLAGRAAALRSLSPSRQLARLRAVWSGLGIGAAHSEA